MILDNENENLKVHEWVSRFTEDGKFINYGKKKKLIVKGTEVTISFEKDGEYISLTDMLKAIDGDFFISDWLRNRNTVEFLGIWESVNNPDFNYGDFATIKWKYGKEQKNTD
jgi:hypothetical protein